MVEAYDPLDYENLAASVVRALLERTPIQMPPEENFEGAGVYAIYYHGPFAPYQTISRPKHQKPIYVGKADPSGGRKGKIEKASEQGRELLARLRQHAKTIEQAENLKLADFSCRFLVVVPVWITLAEQFLINHYRPVWNVVLDGFGNHPPGKGRKDMRCPRWDIVHPGRDWAKKLRADETREQVLAKLEEFFRG